LSLLNVIIFREGLRSLSFTNLRSLIYLKSWVFTRLLRIVFTCFLCNSNSFNYIPCFSILVSIFSAIALINLFFCSYILTWSSWYGFLINFLIVIETDRRLDYSGSFTSSLNSGSSLCISVIILFCTHFS